MLLNLSFVLSFCYFIEITKSHFLHSKYALAENKEELINFIRSLKYHQNGEYNVPDTDPNDEEKEKKIQNIIWLLKKNYKAQKHFEYLNNYRFHSAARVYFIENPSVLEEYKNNLNKIIRFSKVNLKNNDQQNTLKTKLRNLRRDAMFRLGSSESENEEIHNKQESKLQIRNDFQDSNNPIAKTQDAKVQVLKKDMIQKYPVLKDTLELHSTNVHNKLRSDYAFRQEKNKWDERKDNPDTVEMVRINKNKYQNQPSHVKKRFEFETVNWDKITTKDYPMKYKKKKFLKESEYKIKHSYNRNKNEYINKDFHSYGRTSIPFVGKRGIYDEK